MYRLLAIDLDGTLLTPQKVITPRSYRAIQRVVEQGVLLVIATGQKLDVLQAYCATLPLTAPQILYNGALIMDISSGFVYHQQLVPSELILPALDILQDLRLFRGYHTLHGVYVDSNTPNAQQWYRPPVPSVIEVPDVKSLYPQPCQKLVAVGMPATLQANRQELERIFSQQLYVTQVSRQIIELLHPEVSKGKALMRIAEMLSIASHEIVAIGDHHNDIAMLRYAGMGIAMGNASDEVKAAANYVTARNSEEGVALAIEEKLLPYLQ